MTIYLRGLSLWKNTPATGIMTEVYLTSMVACCGQHPCELHAVTNVMSDPGVISSISVLLIWKPEHREVE